MNTKENCLSNKYKFILNHPYIAAGILCIFVMIFTFGQQKYISAETVIIFSFAALFFLCKKFVINSNKAKYIKFGLITAGTLTAGMLFANTGYKGGIFLSLVFAATIVIILVMYKKKLFNPARTSALVIGLAFLMYTAYVLYCVCTWVQTDVSEISSDDGHAGYINYMYDNWCILSNSDPRETWQFYHPPLFYMISSLCVRFFTAFGIPYEQAFENVQVITLFCAFCIVITAFKIFKLFKLKGYALTVSTAIVAFCNATVVLAGSISNDIMSIAFEVGAIYCAMKWYNDRSYKNILQISLCFGLGMMTKLSVWMTAPAIAFLFIYAFFKDIKNFKKYIAQYSVFLAIAAPLALWFPVRNYIMFGIPFGYVPEGVQREFLQTIPAIQRLFDFNPSQFANPFTEYYNSSGYCEFNPLTALFKSALDLQRMGEYTSFEGTFRISLYLMIILGVTGFAFMIFSIFSKKIKIPMEQKIYPVIFYFTMMISYYIFCFKYPSICTENIRYVYPVVILGALYTGMMFQYDFKNKKVSKYVQLLFSIIIVAYILSCIATFVFFGFIIHK